MRRVDDCGRRMERFDVAEHLESNIDAVIPSNELALRRGCQSILYKIKEDRLTLHDQDPSRKSSRQSRRSPFSIPLLR